MKHFVNSMFVVSTLCLMAHTAVLGVKPAYAFTKKFSCGEHRIEITSSNAQDIAKMSVIINVTCDVANKKVTVSMSESSGFFLNCKGNACVVFRSCTKNSDCGVGCNFECSENVCIESKAACITELGVRSYCNPKTNTLECIKTDCVTPNQSEMCCRDMMSGTWRNNTCCADENSEKCCPYSWINNTCCKSDDIDKTEACCTGTWQNNICCKDENSQACCTGTWRNNTCCKDENSQACCPYTWRNNACCKDENSQACCPYSWINNTCCKSDDIDKTEACCTGKWMNGHCCGLMDVDKTVACCTGTWRNNTCCKNENSQVCCTGEWKNGICCHGENTETCCKAYGNEWVFCDYSAMNPQASTYKCCEPGSGVECCKLDPNIGIS